MKRRLSMMSGRARLHASLVACLMGTTALMGAEVARATPEEPLQVGDCYLLTLKQRNADSWDPKQAPVDCSEPHNVEIAGMITPPAGVAQQGLKSGDLTAWSSKTCLEEINAYAGYVESRPETTRTAIVFFWPTADAWAAGDRTVVCAAGVVKAKVASQGVVPTAARGSVKDVEGDQLYSDYSEGGRTTRYYILGMWNQFKSAGQKYPGDKRLKRTAGDYCKAISGPYGYRYIWPSEERWKTGWRWILCWSTAGRL